MAKKILIIDDEKTMVDFLAGMLCIKGHIVLKALNGPNALDVIHNQMLDLVLLDMHLLGLDGLEILKVLRRDYPKVRIIVMTGYDTVYKQKALDIGCDAFFLKPIPIETLMGRIEELLFVDMQGDYSASGRNQAGLVPQSAILFFEQRQSVLKLLLDYFTQRKYCAGEYQIKCINSNTKDAMLRDYSADVVLFDVGWVKVFGEFSIDLINFKNPPKEIITFGEPVRDWDELDVLLERGIIQSMALLEEQTDSPYRHMLVRLSSTLRNVCIKHKLYV